ncbi:MAG: B12-binding domain-containing radical SAM protein [Syntrophobacteraceae bacterium]
MRVLLINSNLKADFLTAPPIGMCYVAQAASFAGHDVKTLDLCFAKLEIEKLLRDSIRSFNPRVIGISIRNIDNANLLHPVSYVPGVLKLIDCIRKISPAPLVLGGSAVSLMPEHILRRTSADYVIVSDGEESFCALLDALHRKESPAGIPGVGMLRDRKFQLTAPRFPRFNGRPPDIGRWVDIAPYQRMGGSYNVQSRRGCAKQCIYCTYNQSLEGSRVRLRDPREVVDEIEEALIKYNPAEFEFVDAVFNDPLQHSAQILQEIVRRPWKARFTAMGMHPPGLDKEYLTLMWMAGFRSFSITPESASPTMIRNYDKGFASEDIFSAATALRDSSFRVLWYFLIGGPGETNATLRETLDFTVQYLRRGKRGVRNVANFFLGVRLYPRTKLWDIALAERQIPTNADPLRQLWYLSRDLDVEKALDQLVTSASTCPEIYLGFDERVLAFSGLLVRVLRALNAPRPYWQHLYAVKKILKSGRRFIYPVAYPVARVAQRIEGVINKQCNAL